jgi:hypothetical protein
MSAGSTWNTPSLRQADPRLDHPAAAPPDQADRWTWLVLAAYAQLRLARQLAGDQRLPWERPRTQPRRSPYRVRRGFPRLLCALGSPAAAPKPSGCPPGRPMGRCTGLAMRYPATKKPTKKPPKKAAKPTKAAWPARPAIHPRTRSTANPASPPG